MSGCDVCDVRLPEHDSQATVVQRVPAVMAVAEVVDTRAALWRSGRTSSKSDWSAEAFVMPKFVQIAFGIAGLHPDSGEDSVARLYALDEEGQVWRLKPTGDAWRKIATSRDQADPPAPLPIQQRSRP